MSLIFGFFNRDGRPADEASLRCMGQALTLYPHARSDFILKGSVGFGHLLTFNTPEARFERLPVYLPDQNVLFSATGRVDNRDELAALLNVRLTPETPDGELLLQAYLRWDTDCPDRILGDWSLSAFKVASQELFLARDHHGYSALTYYVDDKICAFSTSIKALLVLAGVPKKPNESQIIRTLVIRPNAGDETFYENIRLLPPAHTLSVTRVSAATARYWFPEAIPVIHGASQEDRVAELSHIFVGAVRDRLRSQLPVASMLSGGLDSGAVSYVAADLLRGTGAPLATYSHVPAYPVEDVAGSGFGDERPFIAATVEASGNIRPVYVESRSTSPIAAILQLTDILDGPVHAAFNAYWSLDISSQSASDGYGTLLTGENGNATISFAGIEYLLPWYTHYRIFGSLSRLLKQKALQPVLLNISRSILKPYKKRFGSKLANHNYINPGYMTRNRLPEQMVNAGYVSSFRPHYARSRDCLLDILQPGANPRCFYAPTISNVFGLEKRDPTADKRVIEHILSFPNAMFFIRGYNKGAMRVMMREKLPPAVLYNRAKGMQGADIVQRASAELDRIRAVVSDAKHSALAREIIDFALIDKRLSQIKTGTSNRIHVHHLLRTIMVAYFLGRF